jgi:vitamin B12 transporter
MNKLKSNVFTLLMFFGFLVQASDTASLKPVIVTGSHLDDNRSVENGKITGNISIIKREDIQNMPAFSIDQILRFIGGVEIQSRSSFGAQADFSVRGSTFGQVVVLVDGVRIFDPLTGHSNSYIPVAIEEIERIEIIRGGSTYVYGPDALGGVINIVTRNASGPVKSGDKDALIQAGIGSFGLLNARTYFHKDWEKTRVSLGANYVTSPGNPMHDGLRNYFDVGNLSFAVKHEVDSNSSLHFRSGVDYRDYNARFYYTESPFDTSRASNTNIINHFTWNKKWSKVKSKLDFAWQRNLGEFAFNAIAPKNIHTTDFMFAQGIFSSDLSPKTELSYGYQADYKRIESTDRGNRDRWHYGVFVNTRTLIGKWVFEPAIRVDSDNHKEISVSPYLGLTYLTKKGNIGFRGGRAYRYPDFTELYISSGLPGVLPGGRNIGNPLLRPEYSWNLEVNTNQKVAKGLQLNAAVFYRKGTGLIDYLRMQGMNIPHAGNLNDSLTYFHPVNLEDVEYTGIELGIQYHYSFGKFYVHTQAMAVVTRSVVQPLDVYSKYISNHARELVQGSFAIGVSKKGELIFSSLYKSRLPFPSVGVNSPTSEFLILNAGAKYWLINNIMALNFTVENIGGLRYFDVLGAEMAPRWMTLGFIYKPI